MTSSGRVSETMGLEEALPSQVRGGCASAMAVVVVVVVVVMFGVARVACTDGSIDLSTMSECFLMMMPCGKPQLFVPSSFVRFSDLPAGSSCPASQSCRVVPSACETPDVT